MRILGFSLACGLALGALGWGAEALDVEAVGRTAPIAIGLAAVLVLGRSSSTAGSAQVSPWAGAWIGAACAGMWAAATLAVLWAGSGQLDRGPWEAGTFLALPACLGALAGGIGTRRSMFGSLAALGAALWVAVGGPWGAPPLADGGAVFEPYRIVGAEFEISGPVDSVDLVVGACPPTVLDVSIPGGSIRRTTAPLAIPAAASLSRAPAKDEFNRK